MIDVNELEGVEGLQYVCTLPEGEEVTDLAVYNDTLYVASTRNIYVLVDGKRLEQAPNLDE